MSDPLNGKMSNIISHDRDLFARHLAASQERERIHPSSKSSPLKSALGA
jgi:hypothetical protein